MADERRVGLPHLLLGGMAVSLLGGAAWLFFASRWREEYAALTIVNRTGAPLPDVATTVYGNEYRAPTLADGEHHTLWLGMGLWSTSPRSAISLGFRLGSTERSVEITPIEPGTRTTVVFRPGGVVAVSHRRWWIP